MKKSKLLLLASAASLFMTTGCLTTTTAAGNVNADRKQAMLYSEAEVNEASAQAYAETIAEAKKAGVLDKDPATVKRVQNIAERLIAQVGAFREDAKNWNWEVHVITEETVNAWCMAGGKIVVYTGIIKALDLNDAQLAAVMGHEISHALREHSRESAGGNAAAQVGTSVASQILGLGSLGNTVLAAATQYGILLPFSRKLETEADNVGTELMARAGYDPNEAVRVWEKMSALSGNSTPEFMSTHPSNESRIKNLKEIVTKVYPLYQAAKK